VGSEAKKKEDRDNGKGKRKNGGKEMEESRCRNVGGRQEGSEEGFAG
jgi:hypothetical protein